MTDKHALVTPQTPPRWTVGDETDYECDINSDRKGQTRSTKHI